MSERITGLVTAAFTPFTPEKTVNLELIRDQADFYGRSGLEGVFVCGTTGESMSLTNSERKQIARSWVDAAPEGLKVIVHVGHAGLEDAKALAAHARETGAWGIGAMPPFFFKPSTVGELVAVLKELSGSAPELPLYYYHIPALTGVYLPMLDFLEAAKDRIPNLAGIKYTCEDMMEYEMCRQLEEGRFDMLFGRDEQLLCALALGAKGAVGSTYNYAAPLYLKMMEAVERGNWERARYLQVKAMRLVKTLSESGASFLAASKAAMRIAGLDCGPVRPPLSDITGEQTSRLHSELKRLGCLDFFGK